jgi:hypothetical protein
MREVYLAADPVNAEIVKDYLQGHGIGAIVRGAHLWSGQGELPANAYPGVWVLDDADAARAGRLLAEFENGRSRQPSWRCPNCDERLAGQFTACWQCGHERPEDA